MKFLIVLIGIFMLVSCTEQAEETLLETQKDKISYAIGMDIGKNLKKQPVELNPEVISRRDYGIPLQMARH